MHFRSFQTQQCESLNPKLRMLKLLMFFRCLTRLTLWGCICFQVYYFQMYLALIIGFLHGLVFLPVLLSLIGPPPSNRSVVDRTLNRHAFNTQTLTMIALQQRNLVKSFRGSIMHCLLPIVRRGDVEWL